MKNGRAPDLGRDEYLKSGPSAPIELLAAVFNKCIAGGNVTKEWKSAILTSLFKVGNRRAPQNYRRICVFCNVAILYRRILKGRMVQGVLVCRLANGL